MNKKLLAVLLIIALTIPVFSQREVLSLNGTWDIEESTSGQNVPAKFLHKTEVPGLANSAKPAFEGIDKFYSKEYYSNYWAKPTLVKLDINADTMKIGYSFQKRNYLWYRRSFDSRPGNEAVILKINKAQFGTMVFVNGKKAGKVKPGTEAEVPVMLFNDEYRRISGNIEMKLFGNSDYEMSESVVPFSVANLSQNTYKLKIRMPEKEGLYWLYTYAVQSDSSKTLCRRKVLVTYFNKNKLLF